MDHTENATVPAYAQVSNRLRAEIEAGEYRGGRRLPTEAELVEAYGVSRQTVRRAFQDLVAEGIVYRVAGRGTFASDPAQRYRRQLGSIEDLLELSADTTMEVIESLRRSVNIDAASRLRLDTDLLHSVAYLRRNGPIPFGRTTAYLPDPVAALIADAPQLAAGAVSESTVIGLLEPHLASPIITAAQSITVARATEELAAQLNCAVDHPLLRVDRLYSNAEDVPTELSVSYFVPEHYTYRVTLHRAAR
ncbi:MAG: GntR family transcriptional regulator [Nocardiaceae bacterium]|nr:GntR family transcriptional regulator [Nocardiaceae bacterium]